MSNEQTMDDGTEPKPKDPMTCASCPFRHTESGECRTRAPHVGGWWRVRDEDWCGDHPIRAAVQQRFVDAQRAESFSDAYIKKTLEGMGISPPTEGSGP